MGEECGFGESHLREREIGVLVSGRDLEDDAYRLSMLDVGLSLRVCVWGRGQKWWWW